MKIGFDGKRAAQNRTGLGNYSRYIIELIARHFNSADITIYIPDAKKTKLLQPLANIKNIKIESPQRRIDRFFKSLWRIWGVTKKIKENEIDIYHGLSNELPLSILKAKSTIKVVTIHDLIFLQHPECYKPIDRWIYNYKFRKACKNADSIIAISECTKRDIIRYYNIADEKIKVIYQGCDAAFNSQCDDDTKAKVKSKYNLPDKFILNVGSIERRKNAKLIVESLPSLSSDIHTVIVGRRTPYTAEVATLAKELNVADRVHIITNVPFADLPAIYHLADVFAYTSRYEGFGIPILEATRCGIPVVACTGSCLEEAGGAHAPYVDPDDSKALAEAIRKILEDENYRANLIAEGHKYAQRFDDEPLAKEMIDFYNNLRK